MQNFAVEPVAVRNFKNWDVRKRHSVNGRPRIRRSGCLTVDEAIDD